MDLSAWTEFYLVNLLARRALTGLALSEPLVLKLKQAVEAERSDTRFYMYRDVGDNALMLSGFFPDYIARKGVAASYVVSMGTGAYRVTASLSARYDGLGEAYEALSEDFAEFARLIDEVRSLTTLRVAEDTVSLFEHWKKTKSPSTAERLWSKGLVPDRGDYTD